MSRILVVGAGLVARPLVRYLCDQPDLWVTVADQDFEKAEALAANLSNCEAVRLRVGSGDSLNDLVADHEVSVSLLPANLHPLVATLCAKSGRHMVTASYVSPAIEALDHEARKKGLTFLNEVGVDPGLDHMSAMRIIDDLKRRGGHVTHFQSFCGGVPAPESDDNPWRYKVSWSPRGVCMAANGKAQFARNGRVYTCEGAQVFEHPDPIEVEGMETFEAYPNRDSLKYIELYGLRDVKTMFRGTLRYAGWCETMRAVLTLGLIDDDPVNLSEGSTFAQFMMERIGTDPRSNPGTEAARKMVADKLGLAIDHPVLERLAFLGLFSSDPVPVFEEITPLDIVAGCMEKKLMYAPGERDLIAMKHYFVASFEQRHVAEHITATMIAHGEPDGDSAMSRTVGLPAAVAAKLIATRELDWPGVQVPVVPQIYDPILDALAAEDIRFVETKYTQPL